MATKAPSYKIEATPNYTGRYTYTGPRGRKVSFGFVTYEISRTCSARELGSLWLNDDATDTERRRVAKFIREYLKSDIDSTGNYISYQHSAWNIRLLKDIGFKVFCTYMGNEDELVHGLTYCTRSDDWEKEYNDDDYREDDEYQW